MKSKKLYIISLIIVYSINLYFYFQSKDLKIILITILLSIPLIKEIKKDDNWSDHKKLDLG